MFRSPLFALSLVAILVSTAPLARAAEAAAPASAPAAAAAPAASPAPAAPAEVKPVEAPKPDTTSLEAALKVAKEAADAARMAAEAAKASTDALREALKPKAEAPAAPPAPPSPWKFVFGLAGVAVSGNANAMTASATGKATGTFAGWSVVVNAGAAYGQTTTAAVSATEVTAMNALLDARGDLKLGDTFGLFLKGGGMTDRVAKIEAQGFGELGASIKWFELKEPDFTRAKLNTDLGFRYTRENRAQFFPTYDPSLEDINILAPRANLEFMYAINKTSLFTFGAEVLPDIINLQNLRVSSYARLAAQLMDGVSLTVGFKVRFIGAPAAGAQTTDTETLVGVTWTT